MSLFLANANQKFKKKAIYYKQVASSDGEELRYSVQGMEFRYCDYERIKINRLIIAEGVITKQANLAILTDYKGAIRFEPDDIIKVEGHDRRVLWIGKIKNYSTPNAVAYAIGLL